MNNITLYDKIINVTLKGTKVTQYSDKAGNILKEEADIAEVTIECGETGIKPTIDLSFGLLPNRSVIGVTVIIKNFFIDFDVRAWTEMKIVAGYRDGVTTEFYSQVYASYRETPSPDGDMVFKGIIVGSTASIFNEYEVSIAFNKDVVTLKEFLKAAADASVGLSISWSLGTYIDTTNSGTTSEGKTIYKNEEKNVEDIPISVSKATFKWKGTYAMCLSIQEILSSACKLFNITIECIFFGNKFSIVNTKQLSKEEKVHILEDTYDLSNCTYSSSRVASLVHVKAPWVPSLMPGDIFYLPQRFYSAEQAALPNIISEVDIKAEKDLYRVIKMDVAFNTTTGTNEMIIMGVPVQSNPVEVSNVKTYATTAELFHAKNNNRNLTDVSTKEGENLGNTIYHSLTSNGVDYTVVSGDYLIYIAQKFYSNITYTKGMDDVVNGKKIRATVLYHYGSHTVDGKIENGLYKAVPYQKSPIYSGKDFWPLIAEATFARIEEFKNMTMKVNYQINKQTPDDIEPGWVLRIPSLNSPEQYIGQKDIFKQMYKVYKSLYRKACNTGSSLRQHKDRYGTYTATMANIYIYMGGTDLDG